MQPMGDRHVGIYANGDNWRTCVLSFLRAIRNELHRLPIDQRIVYKLCLMVYKCQHSPGFIIPVVTLCATLIRHNSSPHAGTHGELNFSRTTTVTFCSCAVAVSGPTCWNSLPLSLKSSPMQTEQFWRQPKSTRMTQSS